MFGLHVINFNWHIANQLYKITLYLPTRSGSWQWFSRAAKYNCYPSKEALFYVYHCSSRKKAAYRGSLSVCNWSTTTIVWLCKWKMSFINDSKWQKSWIYKKRGKSEKYQTIHASSCEVDMNMWILIFPICHKTTFFTDYSKHTFL